MVRFALSIAVLALALVACGGKVESGQAPPTPKYGNLPLTFVEHDGRLLAQGPGHAFAMKRGEIAFALQRASGQGVALDLDLVGARDVAPVGTARAAGTVNYVNGADAERWRTNVPAYDEVAYRELWPGVDMRLHGRDGELEYEFRVKPGANPDAIRLAYRGVDGLAKDNDGGLDIATALGTLRDAPPVAYQEIGGVRVPVESSYTLDGREYGFRLGSYDPARELVIDPALAYSTLLGGASHEVPAGIAVDDAGNAYVTGFTQSPDFPTTPGAYDRTGAASNSLDVFVSKLNPSGTALVYSTFIGGSNFDWGRSIAIDAAGNAYVTGQTKSSDFPTTGGAFDRTFNVDSCPRCGVDQYDGFVLKLNASGSGLSYSTFLGGTQIDDSVGIAIDGARNAYVTGQTGSSNFPTTSGAFDRTPGGGFDAFVAKLNATGSALSYSTLLGGADTEQPEDVRVDASGNAVVGGSTRSTDFPTTPGAYDRTHNGGGFDAFATKLDARGSGLVYSTFVGGSGSDGASDLALDAAGNAYMVGSSQSADFPTTAGAFDPTPTGTLALKLDPSGESLVYSTFLDGAGAGALALDADGRAWIAGGRGGEVTVARLDATGSALELQTTFGGSEIEAADDVALDAGGVPYLAGHTFSPNFPTTPGAFDRTWAGDPLVFWGDGFVTKLDLTGTLPEPAPAPAAPALVSPADAATVTSPVTFDWDDVAGAVSYTIQIDESQSFGLPLVSSANTTASEFTTSSLPDGTWYWRVRALNAEGTPGAWSAVRTISFSTAPPPPPPPVPGAASLVSPADGAAVTQPFTFDWSDVADAAWYTIEVDDSTDFAAPLVWAATTTPSQLTTSSLPNGTLFWRVRAFNSDGIAGPVSDVRSVQVGAAPSGPLAAPSLISPASDARFSPGESITFDWSDVTGATSYTIQIDDSDTFSAPLTVNETVTASRYTTSSLPTSRLWWRVRANDGGAWSSARRMEVKA